jgi:succinyl-CoA synthetase alpha subunit
MIGEIGGSAEADAAEFYKRAKKKKPIAGFIAGVTAPKGRRMGHAGAIISGGNDTAAAKVEILKSCGFVVSDSPAALGEAVKKAMAA